jgi:NAD(P)-dependent dehydrogenase (short-subunit alcohol dehydrogenase family)
MIKRITKIMKNEKWTAENIPSQKGKIAIVTGSSSGIGFEASRVLANKGAEVIIAVRNKAKGENAVRKIKEQNSAAKVKLMILDLADLKSIEQFASRFKDDYSQLDILINNAGVMMPPYGKTKDGFELQFGTNHLGHFALTGQLIDLLKKTPKSRLVNVSSGAHNWGNLDFEDLNWENRKYKPGRAYGDSKIANLYFTYEMSNRLNGSDINVSAAHPGWTATDLQRHSGLFSFGNKLFAMPIEQGTLPTLRAATDESVKSGDYYGPDGWREMKGYPVLVESNKLSHNKEIAKKLWDVSKELTGVKFNI